MEWQFKDRYVKEVIYADSCVFQCFQHKLVRSRLYVGVHRKARHKWLRILALDADLYFFALGIVVVVQTSSIPMTVSLGVGCVVAPEPDAKISKVPPPVWNV